MKKAIIFLAVVAATTAGCSFGQKQHMADAIVASVRAAEQQRTATGMLDASVVLVRTRVPPPPGPPRITPLSASGIPVSLDLTQGTAAVGDRPQIVFTRDWVYERRTSVRVGVFAASNLMPFVVVSNPTAKNVSGGVVRGRPWLQLDFARLPRRDLYRTAGSLGINPAFFLTLLKGTLTGSVKKVGDDGTTTHYKMNVGRDKAERGLSDKAKTTLDRIFRANAISGLVYAAEVWIDRQGLPRLVTLKFRESLGSDTKADLTIRMALGHFGDPVSIVPPGKTETATVRNFGQLVHAAVGA